MAFKFKVVRADGDDVKVTVLHAEEWSALYYDGLYVTAGDPENIWETLMQDIGGDEMVVSPGRLLFPDKLSRRQTGTLDEVRERIRKHEEKLLHAAELESQATTLLDRARELRGGLE